MSNLDKDILKGNIAIAKFCGATIHNSPFMDGNGKALMFPNGQVIEKHCLSYHSDWNQLMGVWKKCIEVIGLWAYTHKEDRHSKVWLEASERISRAMSSIDINKTFSEINHLIQWYNQSKQ